MSTAPTINHPSYFADYQALREQLSPDSPAWLNDLRAAAWERFDTSGFPTARRGNEPWKYTNVRPIAQGQFSAAGSRRGGPVDLLIGADGRPNVGDFLNNSWAKLIFLDGQPLIGGQPDTPTGVHHPPGLSNTARKRALCATTWAATPLLTKTLSWP